MQESRNCGVCHLALPLAPEISCPYLTCPQSTVGGKSIASISDTSKMNGAEFELFVRDRLAERGYVNIETTPASGDMGADLIVRQNGRVIVIQCKRHAGVVGLQAVQEVLGAKSFYEAHEAWVVTDSTFTESARKLARSANVRLKRLILRSRK